MPAVAENPRKGTRSRGLDLSGRLTLNIRMRTVFRTRNGFNFPEGIRRDVNGGAAELLRLTRKSAEGTSEVKESC